MEHGCCFSKLDNHLTPLKSNHLDILQLMPCSRRRANSKCSFPGSFCRREVLPLSLQSPQAQRITVVRAIQAVDEDLDAKLECLDLMKRGALGDHPDEQSLWKVAGLDIKQLTTAASFVRDRGAYPNVISFSPKVFIPLTRACRDACGYCTFALAPKPGQAIYMTVDEVLEVAHKGAEAGCTEALFTLGDKPELLYPRAKEELGCRPFLCA